ncbi:MAG: hypothetical protein EZS28_031251, partial [Streblomastix strix]
MQNEFEQIKKDLEQRIQTLEQQERQTDDYAHRQSDQTRKTETRAKKAEQLNNEFAEKIKILEKQKIEAENSVRVAEAEKVIAEERARKAEQQMKEAEGKAHKSDDVESNQIYVKNFAQPTTNAGLRTLFEQVGPVKEAHIISHDGISQGYGYVTMYSSEAAQRAINTLNNHELNGRNIGVEFAKPRGEHGLLSKTRVHLGNLPFELTEDELRDAFQGFAVKDVDIVRRADDRPAGFGFIEFENEADQR